MEYKKVYPPRIRPKKITLNVATKYNTGLFSNYSGSQNPVVELRNILIKSTGIEVVAKNYLQPLQTMFLPQIILKVTI